MPLGYFRIRQILPSAMKTQTCANKADARAKTLWLYRTCLRQAGEIQALYPLDVPVYQIRRRMRQEFEKNRYVDNLDAINVLLFRGILELEETLYMWKTVNHVMNYFKDAEDLEEEGRKKDFLSGFLEGGKA